MHLAHLNISRPRFALHDPRIADFISGINRVNALAQRSEGYVWRLGESGGEPAPQVGPWGPDTIFTLSVWESVEALEGFVWRTIHKRFHERRQEWFETIESDHFVMWWVPEGHRPTLEEAAERLDHLDVHGDTDRAFGWGYAPHLATLAEPALRMSENTGSI